MRPPRTLLALAPALAVALAIGCGGSGDDRGPPELSAIPTATFPSVLPEPVIVGEVVPARRAATYTIQSGDTLAGIADRFGTTAETIAEVNDIADPTQLEVGQVLTIPGVAPETQEVLGATAEPPPPPEPAAEGATYTVQSGDNSSDIADSFGITLEEMAAANNTTIDDLRDLTVGDVLVIPSPTTATPEPAAP